MLRVEDVDITPNPHALKFILNEKLLNFERRQFGNKADAANDPLALGVFEIAGVVSVFYTDKFITIEKFKEVKEYRAKYRNLLSQVKKQIRFLRSTLRGKESI